MATFMLVHGTWHGGWCWRKLARHLRAGGHEVYAPSLTGLGDRSHLLSPAVDLHTHVRDIVDLMEFEDLTEVVLVGHSYGGMVIAGVADLAPRRIGRLVYLDAVTPKDGQSLSDIVGIELMCAAQGLEFLKPLRPGPKLAEVYGRVRERVPALERDAPLSGHIQSLTSLIAELAGV